MNKKTLLFLLVGAFVVFALYSSFKTQTFGSPIGVSTMQVDINFGDGSSTSKNWGYYIYDDCTVDMPGYVFYEGGKYVNIFTGQVVTDPTNQGGGYQFRNSVYGNPKSLGNYGFTTSRPRQEPSCIQEIINFAKSANVELTQVVYINTTIVQTIENNTITYICPDGYKTYNENDCTGHAVIEKIYTNQTIYLCNGQPTVNAQDCEEEAVPVTTTQENNAPLYAGLIIGGIVLGYIISRLKR